MKKAIAFINTQQQQAALHKGLLLALLVALFIPHWIISYHGIQTTIAPDLLLRTIGSRLQQAGQPIYQYQWKPGDPVAWLNPYPDTRVGLNGVVTTPFALWLLQPLAKLDYCTIRNAWGVTQEAFLFATTWFCCLTFQRRFHQWIFIAIGLLFFIYDRNWLLNLYNGQMYVVYACAFAVVGYLISKQRKSKNLLIWFPVLSLIRPFFITALIPFVQLKKQHVLLLVTGAVIAILLVVLSTSTSEWKQYNSAMKLYAKEQTGELKMNTMSPALYARYADPCTLSNTPSFKVFGAGCLYSLQHYLYLCCVSISNVQFYQLILILSLGVLWLIAYRRNWLQHISKQLILSFLFYQLCELITPASRNPYNMIQWLPAVAWLIAYGNPRLMWLIIIGLCLNHDIPIWFKYEREIGEMFLFAAAGLFLFQKNNETTQKL